MAVKFPIVVWATGKEKIPDSPFVIIMAKNGTFLLKRAGIVEAAVPYNEPISGLATFTPWAELNVEKIPFGIFMQVFHFFREIYKSKKSECNVILFYNPKGGLWSPVVPLQVVTHSSVHYKDGMAGAQEGWVKVGTFHSHCDFSAGHSGGDHRDEEHFDGIHMTIGHVDSNPTLSVSLVVNGNRFMKAPQEYIAGVRRIEETIKVQEYEIKWVDDDEPDEKSDEDTGKEDGSLLTSMTGLVTRWLPKFGGGEVSGASTTYTPHRKTSIRFYRPQKRIEVPTKVVERTITKLLFDFPEGKTVEDYPFPEEWLGYVKTQDEIRKESTPAPVYVKRKRRFRHKAGVIQPPEDSHLADADDNTGSGEPGNSRTDEEGAAFTHLSEDELAAIIARHERGCQEGEE